MILKNSAWAGLDYVVGPLGAFLGTPVLLNALGLEGYGTWVLINSLVGLGAFANFGFGDTALRFVALHLAEQRGDKATRVVGTAVTLSLCLGLFVAALFVVGAPWITRTLRIGDGPDSIGLIWLAGCLLSVRVLESLYVATLRGSGRYDLAARATVSVKTVSLAVTILLAVYGFTLKSIIEATLAVAIVGVVVLFAFSARVLGRAPVPGFHSDTWRDIRSYVFWSGWQNTAGAVFAQADRLIIGSFLGPSAAGLYGACAMLAQQVHASTTAVAHQAFPRIVQATAASSGPALLRREYLRATSLVNVIAIAVGVTLATFSSEILTLWLGPQIAGAGHLVLSVLALAYTWFTCTSVVTYFVLNGTGQAREQTFVSVTAGLIFVVSALLLTEAYGIVGASCSRLPDLAFRALVRARVARGIVEDLSGWFVIDFVGWTAVALLLSLVIRMVLPAAGPAGTLLQLTGVAAAVLTVLVLGSFLPLSLRHNAT